MEFHVVDAHPCAIHETETNFRLIKSAVAQLRQDMVDAEMEFHRRPMGPPSPDEKGGGGGGAGSVDSPGGDEAPSGVDSASAGMSSVGMLSHCVYEWTKGNGHMSQRAPNRFAKSYYSSRSKAGRRDAGEYAAEAARKAEAAAAAIDGLQPARPARAPRQVKFGKGLSPMWMVGSNPPTLCVNNYADAVLEENALRVQDPDRPSTAFAQSGTGSMSTAQLVAAGSDHASMRPRFLVPSTGCRGDEVHLDAGATTSAKLGVPKLFPDSAGVAGPRSVSRTFSRLARMPAPGANDGAMAKLRPQLGATGPDANLGSTYNQGWDEAAWARTSVPFSRDVRVHKRRPPPGPCDPGAVLIDQGPKMSLATAAAKSPHGRFRQGQGAYTQPKRVTTQRRKGFNVNAVM
jgi:hypothetical protein